MLPEIGHRVVLVIDHPERQILEDVFRPRPRRSSAGRLHGVRPALSDLPGIEAEGRRVDGARRFLMRPREWPASAGAAQSDESERWQRAPYRPLGIRCSGWSNVDRTSPSAPSASSWCAKWRPTRRRATASRDRDVTVH